MMEKEPELIVRADESEILHRGYYEIDSALEEDSRYRDSRIDSERVYAARNRVLREGAVRLANQRRLAAKAKRQQAFVAVR